VGLVIQVDGGHHFEPIHEENDNRRTAWLESRGLRVLRFDNREVLTETEAVLEQILSVVQEQGGTPSP
jgi:very-short-patch-repair endonuclease